MGDVPRAGRCRSYVLCNAYDRYVHTPAISLTQRHISAFTGDGGVGVTVISDKRRGATMRTWLFLATRPGLTQRVSGTRVVQRTRLPGSGFRQIQKSPPERALLWGVIEHKQRHWQHKLADAWGVRLTEFLGRHLSQVRSYTRYR